MVVPENKLQDELLPELEISIIPSKLSDDVRIDLFGLNDEFLQFLVKEGIISEDVHNDIHFMPLKNAIGFCRIIRDKYRIFNVRKINANV